LSSSSRSSSSKQQQQQQKMFLAVLLFLSLSLLPSFALGYHRRGVMSMVQLSSSSRQQLQKKVFLFNTQSRAKELFEPVTKESNKVSFYSCGPTVYDFAHIGNFRAFLTYDVLKRWLRYVGFDVRHVCNLTDVDDKIIVKMQAEGQSLLEVTNKYTDAFFEDLDVLNIVKADKYPKATEHIADIVAMIEKLISTGHAYEKEGSVYFRTSAFAEYGKLANLKFDAMQEGAGGFGPNDRRGQDEKENARDFALWKAFSAQDGEVVWDSPFGRGRPGWHIECSAMCHCLLGPTIDIHAGGVDLVFPHHTNEVAQSEAFSGEPFSKYWLHNGFVNINNEKMSKSLKNFKTLRDIATSPFDARAFRFMVVTAQYRNPLNFTPDTLKAAINSLRRIDKLVNELTQAASGGGASSEAASTLANETGEEDKALMSAATAALVSFDEAMCDDMNTPRASAALFGLVGGAEKALKKGLVSRSTASSVLLAIRKMDEIFGVLYQVPTAYFAASTNGAASTSAAAGAGGSGALAAADVPESVALLVAQRSELKAQKKYAEADAVRAQISALGFTIKDGKGGVEVFRL